MKASLFLFLLSVFPGMPAHAGDPYVGNITGIESSKTAPFLNILRAGKKGFAQVKLGDAVFVGDTIKTGPGQKARLQLPDSSTINMGPDSVLKMKAVSLRTEEAKRSMVFKALKGTIRFIIEKTFKAEKHGSSRTWLDSTVVVEATTMVAGVRGTDFFIVVKTDGPLPEAEAAVLEGVVTARNSDFEIKGVATLSANEMVTLARGAVPPDPSPLSPEHRAALINLTTPTGNGFLRNLQQSRKKYTGSDMERDVAAGVPLSQVFVRSVSSGMAVNEMVAAAIDAGLAGYPVVYTAIIEGYAVTAVVDAAITAGVPLVDVVAAAVIAGAETRMIVAGAQLAGVPEEAIAAALSDYTSNLSPYGYTPPENKPASGNIAPPPAIVIGGGGGAPPSKNPSPYNPHPFR